MIQDQWYIVLDSRELKTGKAVGVTRMGENLVFWRDPEGRAVCMRDRCPHLGARLSQGVVRDGNITCPFHGFSYDPRGQCQHLPAYGRSASIPRVLRTACYPTFEAHDFIWIFWGKMEKPPPPVFFDFADKPGFSYAGFKQHWGVHYSRMVENQLDVMHLPFVHHNTIGRGGRMVVDGPLVKLVDNLMEIWVYNRIDDGTPPKKAEDLPEPLRHPFLQFRFPNLWQNWISDDIRIVIAFVPVDEENGILYGRYYQRMVRLPVVRGLINLVGKWASIVIAGQDRRIVTNQFPKKTDLRMGEKMVQGDRAILLYRQHRRALKDAMGQLD